MALTDIVLQDPQPFYSAGDWISGTVIYSNEAGEDIQGINVNLKGVAKTCWMEGGGRSLRTVKTKVVYLTYKIKIFGNSSSWNGEPEIGEPLSQGAHVFYFIFQLPKDLPSTFEHKYGSISYFFETDVLKRKQREGCRIFPYAQQAGPNSHNYKWYTVIGQPLTVKASLDLNDHENANQSALLSKQKIPWGCFLRSGPLGFHLKLPRRGFVSGETIPCEIKLFNCSKKDVPSVSISLIQEIKLQAQGYIKIKHVVIRTKDGPHLYPGQERVLTTSLNVPCLPSSQLQKCAIIDINYFLKVKMEVKNGFSLKGTLPVIIGTIPLQSNENLSEIVSNPLSIQSQQSHLHNNNLFRSMSTERVDNQGFGFINPLSSFPTTSQRSGLFHPTLSERDSTSISSTIDNNQDMPPAYDEALEKDETSPPEYHMAVDKIVRELTFLDYE